MKKIVFCLCAIGLVFASCRTEEPSNSASSEASNPELENTQTVMKMPKSPKRGVAFNISSMEDAMILADFISWHYNWGNESSALTAPWLEGSNIDYCPMCWSNYNADKIRNYVKNHPNTKYLLGFNEPNLTDQANMTPKQAAEKWPAVVALAKELNLKLGAPAMNHGTLSGYNDPWKWLDEFFKQPGCSLDDIDCIPIHCYMGSPAAVQGYVEKFYKYNKPIWMTEFCAWENISNVQTQKQYMTQVVNYFESNPQVERYAWFIPRNGKPINTVPYNQLLTPVTPIELTELGQIYANMSSQDKSVCISSATRILACWYSATQNNAVYVTNTTDTQDNVMVFNFNRNAWLQYQVDAVKPISTISLRCSTTMNTQLTIYVDGKACSVATIASTKGAWSDVPVDLKATFKGKHYIRLEINNDGYLNFGSFTLK